MMTEENVREDRIHIRFEGGLADQNRIPVQEFITSLDGWHDFLDLSTTAFLTGRLTTDRLPSDRRVRYEIQTVREGSVEVILETVGLWAAQGIVGGGAAGITFATGRALWRWRHALFNRQVQSHRDDATIEEAAAALAHMAREHQIAVGDEDDPADYVERIDATMKRAVRPVTQSVTHVSMRGELGTEIITAASSQKRALDNDYSSVKQPERVGDFEAREVIFRRINIESGSASVTFVDPHDEDEVGIKRCWIIDANLRTKRDPYTGSMHKRSPLQVLARKKVLNSETGAVRWEVTADQDEAGRHLFNRE
ncbi:hypothetical protein ACERK3_13105 [Phycisphaerales bacterium AB-hyl4]|uniref:DUF7946 domain-containing protein n=1 Tax=Natronomicrosphaera hydrolytica TaxID=3242702 RepID=A0ABV4U8A5_9BACT